MAIFGHPEGGGGTLQRQAAVCRRALRYSTQIGDTESRPELVRDFKGALLIGEHGQGSAREALFQRGLKRNGGSAQQVEQRDCLGGGHGRAVNGLNLFKQRRENRKRQRRRQFAKPGLSRLGIRKSWGNITAGFGQAEPKHGNSFQIML